MKVLILVSAIVIIIAFVIFALGESGGNEGEQDDGHVGPGGYD